MPSDAWTQFGIEAIKQAPALAILSLLVWYVIRSFKDQQAKSDERFMVLWDRSEKLQQAALAVIDKNTAMNATLMERVERLSRGA